ncbi:hypothetical protein [Nocardiopsis valliformis]|uniref:hypothetical protein n=1 Tax=Nocardiopsis valliformis TaxID=239974 RepID=UPI00037B00E5|nr:hypothetical protein [Nocardiopsis valliformis]
MHTSPCGYFRELFAELRRNRARRVRRYAENVPFLSGVEPRPEPAPFVPAPRQPADHVPVADPSALEDPDELVPGYYRDWERKEALRRVDRSRLGVAVLHTIAEHGEAA